MTPYRPHGLRFAAPAIALLVLSAGAPAAQAQAKLRWSFTKGDAYNYAMTQQTETKVEVQGQSQETKIAQTLDMTWKVNEVLPDGSGEMVQTIDRVRFTLDAAFGNLSFDTNDKADPEGALAAAAPIFRALVGAPIALKMSPRGEITEVKVPEKLLEALRNAGPAAMAAGNIGTEEGLKNLTSRSAMVLPEEAVAKGQSWTSNIDLPLPNFGKMVMDNTYTYEGPAELDGKPVETIGLVVKVEIKPEDNAPIVMTVTEQDNKGAFSFDNAEGILRRSELNQAMKMGISAMGQEFVQEVKTSTKMELVPPGSTKPEPSPAKP